ncbi:carbonic anhydrase [Macroventuria anomochaeta]|uniref:Carbonic anhydrase n=1 Tax=Macroventuria anomochaeta TaxID=301207 RepID=A0ACB6SEL0_9PLEO|nr:carbonic anhydrase [Macroventuria anomochaeta]KAF2632766.1 carbonic anhydrase [Macroventuria anomochaeta]
MLFKSLIFASTASATCLHGLSMFKRAAGSENGTVEVNTFGYGPQDGPFNWASLAPENEACKAGTNQSPINIGTEDLPGNLTRRNVIIHKRACVNETTSDATIGAAADRPVVDIPEQAVEFENLGTTIEVVVNGTTSFDGTDFRLVQFHMHTPSEHHINDEYFPLEVHMVHQGVLDNTQLAVIALMFQVSASNSDPIISGLSSSLDAIATPGTKTSIEDGLDFSSVLSKIETSDILQYSGSLTTPPCAEGVTFLVVKDPLDVGVEDFNKIKSIVKFNSRFIQNTLGGDNMLAIGANSGAVAANATE